MREPLPSGLRQDEGDEEGERARDRKITFAL